MKYKLTEETKEYHGRTLHRIVCVTAFANVAAGDLGGWIENEKNLSQYDNAWVYDNAQVYGDAQVSGNAQVYGDERVRIDEMMKPCKEAEEALGKWIKEFKPRIRKEAA